MPSESTSELKQLENQAATASSSENTDEPQPENQEANASSSSDPQPGCSYQSLPDVMKMIEGITSDTPPEEITFPVIPESSEESDDEDDVVKEEQVLDESNKFLFCGECGRCFKKENMLKRHKSILREAVEMFIMTAQMFKINNYYCLMLGSLHAQGPRFGSLF
ncbi:hypothetical protein JTE90_022985 [Oedothorax gibbosus]|uniref:C2H2-type domain-containing protein n=1 Tax=Oedothorax gibbosus TaxID=931172 RepID=A0AAV6VA79_9ARAC|nr:hypothetical protein JTE90_022985 [Oedothorax gibbosus]